MIISFIQAKKRRQFPKFWKYEWLPEKGQMLKFMRKARPPYYFVETIQDGVLLVIGQRKNVGSNKKSVR